MSKQSDAKAEQGYDPTPSARSCRKCAHFKSTRELPAWMAAANQRKRVGMVPSYTVEINGIEKSLKCGLGGFTVKKTAVCEQFSSPHQSA